MVLMQLLVHFVSGQNGEKCFFFFQNIRNEKADYFVFSIVEHKTLYIPPLPQYVVENNKNKIPIRNE